MAGIAVTEVKVAEVTVRVVFTGEIFPKLAGMVAVIVVLPAATDVARPLLFTKATDALDELQVICMVTSWAVPSENVPVAVNCPEACRGRLGLTGVIDTEDKAAGGVTVRVVLPEIFPRRAVTVVAPGASDAARPVPLTVASNGLDEVQATSVVISWLVPSEYTPRAVSCWLTPGGTLGLAGFTVMEDRVAGVTVRNALPAKFPKVTVMFTRPAARAVARAVLLLIVATDGFDEVQAASGVISKLVPSEYMPMAENFWVDPTGMDEVTDTEVNDAEDDVESPPPPQVIEDSARHPRSSTAKTNLKFFMRTTSEAPEFQNSPNDFLKNIPITDLSRLSPELECAGVSKKSSLISEHLSNLSGSP